MKTIKLLALLAVLAVAGLANAQTLTRSLVLKPAGETNTLTFTSGAGITTSYSILLPGGGNAIGGPIVKTSTAAGTKTWSFGQINLASATATTGDVTGVLGATNGGTGLGAFPINSMLYASSANTWSALGAPSTTGQVLGNVSGVPTWGTTLGGSGATTNISSTGAGNTTNINASPATGGTTNIGNNTSSTVFDGAIDFSSAQVSISLAQNNIWVGNASNLQAAVPPSTNSILITDAVNGGTPQWGTTLPSGLTLPGATITTPTITGGTINNTIIGGTTPAAGTFTNLAGTGTVGLNTSGTGTTTIGNNAGPSVTNIAGDVNFTATTPVNFSVMPELPLTQNNMYVGNASNYASELTTVASRVLTSSAGGVPTWTAVLPIANGGTNSSTALNNGRVMVSTAGAIVENASGTANQLLHGDLSWGAVNLTSQVSNTLPIANGGTNSTATPTDGGIVYGDGTSYQVTAAGTTGQILQSNGTGVPSWTNVGNLLANASFNLTAVAADVTNGYFTVNTTSVPTLVSGYGYDASSRVIVTLESASGPGQVATVTDRLASSFRVYTGAIAVGDVINVLIIDTTP